MVFFQWLNLEIICKIEHLLKKQIFVSLFFVQIVTALGDPDGYSTIGGKTSVRLRLLAKNKTRKN